LLLDVVVLEADIDCGQSSLLHPNISLPDVLRLFTTTKNRQQQPTTTTGNNQQQQQPTTNNQQPTTTTNNNNQAINSTSVG